MIKQNEQAASPVSPMSAENFWLSFVGQAWGFVYFCGGYLSLWTLPQMGGWVLLLLGIIWAGHLWTIVRKQHLGNAWYYWPVQVAWSLYILGSFVVPGTILGAYGVRGAALAVIGAAVVLFFLKHCPGIRAPRA